MKEMTRLSLIEMKYSFKDAEQRLDPDNTQIILKSLFLNHFYPDNRSEQHFTTPLNGKPFLLYHYNGLPRSNKDKKLRYASAQATISDFGYGNEIPSSAVASVIPGIHLLLLLSFPIFFFRYLFTNNRCLENEMGNY